MGMYDTLGNDGDNQVKAFDVPCFYASSSPEPAESLFKYKLGYIGGLLRYFAKDADVPYKTWWYKYPENFIIMDINIYGNSGYQDLFHVITEGKYRETYENTSEIPEEVFHKVNTFMGKFGTTVNGIHDRQSLNEYITMLKQTWSTWYSLDFGEKELHKQMQEYIKEKRKNPSPELMQKIDENLAKLKEVQAKKDEKSKEIFAPLKEKFPSEDINADTKYGDYGGYLDCMKTYTERENHDNDKKINYLGQLKQEFERYSSENNLTIDGYLEWYKPETEKEEMEIRNFAEMLK